MNELDLFAPTAAEPTRTEGFVLCEFGGITLAISRAEVVTIEHAHELGAPLPDEAPLGWFESAQGPWPVFGLDAELQLMNRVPDDRAFLAFLKSADTPIGLLCESVRIVGSASELTVQPLPAVMRDRCQPIDGIARLDERRIALVAGEGTLVPHLQRLGSCDATAVFA